MVDKRATENAAQVSALRPRRLLNVFALPSQTVILAAMLTAVMYGALAAISVNSPIAIFWLLIVALIVLSIRGLLAWPDRIIRKHSLKIPDPEHEPLKQRIVELAAEIGVKPAPGLLLTVDHAGPEAVGALRRRYIFLNQELAGDMTKMLRESNRARIVDAVLLHELSHFRHGDNLLFGYARALLGSGGALIGWAALFLLGFTTFLIRAAFEFLQYSPAELAQRFEALLPGIGMGQLLLQALGPAEEWEALRRQVSGINLGLVAQFAIGNTFPLALLSLGLLVFLWTRLMRIRELYADVAVAQLQHDITPLTSTSRLFAVPLTAPIEEDSSRRRGLVNAWESAIRQLGDTMRRVPGSALAQSLRRRVFDTHYPGPRRLATLRDPARIYDGWLKTAVIFGMFILVLEMLLLGTSALFFAGNWPLHVFVLPAFILLSLHFMVRLVLGQPGLWDIVRIVGVMMIPHSVLLILTILTLWIAVIIAPAAVASFFDTAAAFYSGVVGTAQAPLAIDSVTTVIQATIINLLQLPAILIITTGALAVSMGAMRRMLTWYGLFRSSGDWQRLCYRAIALLGFVLAIGVLPPITDLILLRFDQLLAPSRLVGMLVGLLAIMAGGWWFRKHNQAYARRCARCGHEVAGEYHLGRECPNPECGAMLNPWLLVSYNVERQQRGPLRSGRPEPSALLQQGTSYEQD